MKYLTYLLLCATLMQCVGNPPLRVQTEDLVIEVDTATQLAYDTLKIPPTEKIPKMRLMKMKVRNICADTIQTAVLEDSIMPSGDEYYPILGDWTNSVRCYWHYKYPAIPPQAERIFYLRYRSELDTSRYRSLKAKYTKDNVLPDSVHFRFFYYPVRKIEKHKDIYIYFKMNKHKVVAVRKRDLYS